MQQLAVFFEFLTGMPLFFLNSVPTTLQLSLAID